MRVISIYLVRFLALSSIQLVLLSSLDLAQAQSETEDEIFRNYKPLAMDESWSLVGSKSFESENDYTKPISWLDDIRSKPSSPMRLGDNDETMNLPGVRDIEEWPKTNISKTIFALPRNPSTTMTKLITGKETPTFIDQKLVKPDKINPRGKVLATYKILIPIFIPAVVKTTLKPKHEDMKFVKEIVTEMVPVKSIVPHVKEVIKAERVPQKVITDYVETNGNSVPPSVDDKLRPDERVITSVVKNYD